MPYSDRDEEKEEGTMKQALFYIALMYVPAAIVIAIGLILLYLFLFMKGMLKNGLCHLIFAFQFACQTPGSAART